MPARHTAACALALVLVPLAAGSIASGKPRVKFDEDWAKHPSARYAAMSAPGCRAELARRKIRFTNVARAPGVLAPVRLPEGVGGVVYRTAAPAHARAESPHEVFDCRLALALSDFSKILRAHDIDEVLMFSAWRPPAKGWPEGKLGTRHPGALAIDAYRFGKAARAAPKRARGNAGAEAGGAAARTWLDVDRDFGGRRGAPVCGAAAPPPSPATPAARELRSITCEAADQHIFTSILTPHYDRAHKNHLHLEVTPGVQWHLVR